MNKLIKLKQVTELTALSKPTIYRLVERGVFPRQIKLTPNGRSSAWVLSEVQQWIENRIEASRNASEVSQ